MWIYDNHSEEKHKRAKHRVEEIAVELGAEFVCTKKQKFVTYVGSNVVEEELDINIYKYENDYFDVEAHYQLDRPFIVLSFGKNTEILGDDADPFPYNLPDEELIMEVKYSLGIDPYPEDY